MGGNRKLSVARAIAKLERLSEALSPHVVGFTMADEPYSKLASLLATRRPITSVTVKEQAIISRLLRSGMTRVAKGTMSGSAAWMRIAVEYIRYVARDRLNTLAPDYQRLSVGWAKEKGHNRVGYYTGDLQYSVENARPFVRKK